MTITEKLRRAFPGVSALVAAIIGALRAYQEYEKALNAMEALKIKDPVNAWIWDVTHHSMLSYSEALSIYEYLSKFSGAFKQTPKDITEFVIEMANCGRTADMIIRYLKQIDMELDHWARGKLSMRY
jgi:hypothetical protein